MIYVMSRILGKIHDTYPRLIVLDRAANNCEAST